MSEVQELYQTAPYRMTKEELLFAQIRGVILHLDGIDEDPFMKVQDGEEALQLFHIHAEKSEYQVLQEQFYQVPEGNEQFIAYWESFLPRFLPDLPEEEEEFGEPDINDDFPMSLEYPDEDDTISPFDRDYYHCGEE